MRTSLKKYIAAILCMLLVFGYACSSSSVARTPSAGGDIGTADTSDAHDQPASGDTDTDPDSEPKPNADPKPNAEPKPNADPKPAPNDPADPDPSQSSVCTVTVDPQNGDVLTTQSVTAGERVQRPSDPVRRGFVFGGWTAGGETYDFDSPVTSDLIITAVWQEVTLTPPEIDEAPQKLSISGPLGGVLKLAVKEQSGISYTYDWYIDSDSDAMGGSFLAATDIAALTLPLDHEAGDRYFVYCRITGVDNVTGASAHTVSPAVEITIISSGTTQPPADTPVTPTPDPVPDPDISEPSDPTPQEPDAGESLWSGDEYYSEGAKALIATADAYVRRGSWIQYDDTRLVQKNSGMQAIYRHRHGLQSPELATAQNTIYTNCACFINTLIRETFDYDIVSWYTANFIERKDMTVLYYDNTGLETESEKQAIINQVKDLLLPGDLIVTRLADESNGHIIMYVGNGRYVHSTGSNYNYSSGEVYEKNGSIRYDQLDETYFNPSSSRYLPKTGRFAILRPLSIIDKSVPQKTLTRMDSMIGIAAQKLTSHPQGRSANPGDTVSYTVSVENTNTIAKTVSISATLPVNTTLVSGGDSISGRTLSWSATLAPGEIYEVSYSVRLNADVGLGTTIGRGVTTVNGIELYCADIFVANTLTASQMSALDKAARAQTGSKASMGQIINSVYSSAVGDNPRLTNGKALLSQLFSSARVSGYFNLNAGSFVVPALYGGRYVDNSIYHKDRIQMLKPSMLMTGDILLVADSADGSECSMYLVLEGCELLYMASSGAKIMNAEKATALLSGILGKTAFCVLRPSLIF